MLHNSDSLSAVRPRAFRTSLIRFPSLLCSIVYTRLLALGDYFVHFKATLSLQGKADGNKLLIYPTILFFLPNSEIDAMIRQLQEMRKQSQQEASDQEATNEEGEESL